MKVKLMVFLILVSMVSISCVTMGNNNGIKGNRNIITQERTTSSFDGVVLEGVANINIYFSDIYKVVVVTDSNLQEFVTIKVQNNLLHVDTKRNNLRPTKLEINVYMPEIKTANLKGVGNIFFDGGSGSGLEIIFSGVGNVDTENYHLEEINIIHTGVGNIRIWADKINGKISCVGEILYKGNPIMNFDADGIVGKIKRL